MNKKIQNILIHLLLGVLFLVHVAPIHALGETLTQDNGTFQYQLNGDGVRVTGFPRIKRFLN
ncbi:hypothetical protein [Allofustis seminis]|uniref:hypothetical protein n=1 Tax=Allofustis seminis TaxID=166939 RepID=UPI0012EA4DDA|nr:hypothetical protein [Allofustis seminis]